VYPTEELETPWSGEGGRWQRKRSHRVARRAPRAPRFAPSTWTIRDQRLSEWTMPVRLRLAMHGVRHNKFFHLVAIDGRKRRDAKPMELLGVYHPRTTASHPNKSMQWSVDRIKYWLKNGAQPSHSVVRLLTMVSLRLQYMPDEGCNSVCSTGQRHPTRLAVASKSKSWFSTTCRSTKPFPLGLVVGLWILLSVRSLESWTRMHIANIYVKHSSHHTILLFAME
jgi:small subunit ribosomal protein S16